MKKNKVCVLGSVVMLCGLNTAPLGASQRTSAVLNTSHRDGAPTTEEIIGLTASASQEQLTDLHIFLRGTDPISYKLARFSCDGYAVEFGLPQGEFQVEYFNGDGNSLAVLPINGRSLVFANVLSGSGARYVAARYIWSDGGMRGASLSDAVSAEKHTLCRQVESGNGNK